MRDGVCWGRGVWQRLTRVRPTAFNHLHHRRRPCRCCCRCCRACRHPNAGRHPAAVDILKAVGFTEATGNSAGGAAAGGAFAATLAGFPSAASGASGAGGELELLEANEDDDVTLLCVLVLCSAAGGCSHDGVTIGWTPPPCTAQPQRS